MLKFNLYDHRPDPQQPSWDLPPWGHPLSFNAMPLFVFGDGRFRPLGTAFWVGTKVQFVVTAMHVIAEALRYEGRYERLLASGALPENLELRDAGLFVLRRLGETEQALNYQLVPIRTLNGAPPGDVVMGYPTFENGRPILPFPLSFDPPRIGEIVWSIGYTDFNPADGIPAEAIQNGSFDWRRDYSHRFVVTEGKVGKIFTQRFSAGFNNGPCFSFDSEIAHGQSGGPVLTTDARIVGINSAGASHMFGSPTSLASMLYPLLTKHIDFGANFQAGPVSLNLNASYQLVDLAFDGVVSTDGSEQHVGLEQIEGSNDFVVGPRINQADHEHVFTDFQAFQNGRPAAPATEFMRFVRTDKAVSDD